LLERVSKHNSGVTGEIGLIGNTMTVFETPQCFPYCAILRVRATVWVKTVVPEVPAATTVTCEAEVVGPFPFKLPLVPQLDRPTAKAHVDASSK
jgi:hypothetical protein